MLITVACLNSLSDLALDFIIVIIIFLFISLPGGKHIKNVCNKSVYGSSLWPKHKEMRCEKVIVSNHRHSQGLKFSGTVPDLWHAAFGCGKK